MVGSNGQRTKHGLEICILILQLTFGTSIYKIDDLHSINSPVRAM